MSYNKILITNDLIANNYDRIVNKNVKHVQI